MDAASALYASHTLVELALGLLKLRGRYHHESPGSRSPKSAMYCRHHGAALLALALLGGLVWWRGLVAGEAGFVASVVLAAFHYYVLRTTYYVLRTTYYVLRTTYYVLSTMYYVLRTMYYVLRTTTTTTTTTTNSNQTNNDNDNRPSTGARWPRTRTPGPRGASSPPRCYIILVYIILYHIVLHYVM